MPKNEIDPFNVQAVVTLIATSSTFGIWQKSIAASMFMFFAIFMLAITMETHRREMRS